MYHSFIKYAVYNNSQISKFMLEIKEICKYWKRLVFFYNKANPFNFCTLWSLAENMCNSHNFSQKQNPYS